MIELINVSKVFKDTTVIKECSMSFGNKGLVVITGQSGSGKTTMLNMIGLLSSPTTGEVKITLPCTSHGQELQEVGSSAPDWQISNFRKGQISFIFQDSLLLPALTVRENLMLQPEIAGKEISSYELEMTAKELRVENLLEKKINELSAGEKQRLAVVRAVLAHSAVILADEPTGNLDEELAEETFRCLKQVSKKALVVVVTHNETLAHTYANRYIKISNGSIISDEVLDELGIEEKPENTEKKSEDITKKSLNKTIFKLAYCGIKNKKKRYSKITLCNCIMLLIVSLGISFLFAAKKTSSDTSRFYMETNLINLTQKVNDENSLKEKACYFDSSIFSDIDFLREDERIEEVIVKYSQITLNIYAESDYELSVYEGVNIDEYFDKKYEVFNIIGESIENENEVILAADVAKKIFNTDTEEECVGRKFYVSEWGDREFIVAGVNTCINIDGDICSYFATSVVKEGAEQIQRLKNSVSIFSDVFFENTEYLFDERASGSCTVIASWVYSPQELSETDMLCGARSGSENEVVLSKYIIEKSPETFFINGALNEEFMNGSYEGLIGMDIALNKNFGEPKIFKLAGITEEEKAKVYIETEMFESLNGVLPNRISVYVEATEDMYEVCRELEQRGLKTDMSFYYLKDTISARMNSITVILYVLVILVILSAYVTNKGFLGNNITDSINEIGLLRTMGFSRKEIGRLYFYEFELLGSIISLIVCIGYPVSVWLINHFFGKMYLDVLGLSFSVSPLGLLAVMCLGLLMFGIAALPAIRKSTKVEIVDAVRLIQR